MESAWSGSHNEMEESYQSKRFKLVIGLRACRLKDLSTYWFSAYAGKYIYIKLPAQGT